MFERRSRMLLACLLLVAGCSGADPTDTSTTSPGDVPSTSTADPGTTTSTTTLVTPSTTVAIPPAAADATFLVRNGQGVWQIDLDGRAEWLIDGPVAVAVDDTQGGLLFQLDSGRVWDESDPGPSTVWWFPKGANAPQELIVPDEEAGQRVTLHDAFATDAGFAVLYTRHDPGETFDDLVDRLRRIDVPGSTVTQLYAQGVFERGFGGIRSNGRLIAGERWGQVGASCLLLGMDGSAAAHVPYIEDETELHARGCGITPNNELAFFISDDDPMSTTIQIWDLEADEELHRFDILNAGDWVRDLEVGPGIVVANRYLEGTYVAADVVALEPGYPSWQLQLGGQARVLRAPIDINGPYRIETEVAAGPAYYRFNENGAWRVAYGHEVKVINEPIWDLWDDHMGGVIYDAVHHQKYWLPAGATVATKLADLDPTDEFLMQGEQFFTGLVDGTPTFFYAGYAESGPNCGGEWQLVGRDLESGVATGYMCLPIGDVRPGFDSIGGDQFVAATWVYAGCSGTGTDIRFFDTRTEPVVVTGNPGAESCAPCDREALVSPDGRLLAHKVRAYTSPQPDACDLADMERWHAEQLRATELTLEVIDVATGEVIWAAADRPDASLVDFDGRYLVMDDGAPWERGQRSTIYDTADEHAPVVVEGRAKLMRSSPLTLHVGGLGAASFGDPVGPVMARLTALLGPPSEDTLWDPLPDHVGRLPQGFAADDYFRHSSWPQIGLSVVFSDAGRYRDDGIPHFVAWYSTEAVIATTSGLRVDDTVDDLVARFGDRVRLAGPDECNTGYMFWIGDALAGEETMNGGLSGGPDDPATRITYIHAGAHSSC